MAKNEKKTANLPAIACEPTFKTMVEKAAKAKFMGVSEYTRQAILEKIAKG